MLVLFLKKTQARYIIFIIITFFFSYSFDISSIVSPKQTQFSENKIISLLSAFKSKWVNGVLHFHIQTVLYVRKGLLSSETCLRRPPESQKICVFMAGSLLMQVIKNTFLSSRYVFKWSLNKGWLHSRGGL